MVFVTAQGQSQDYDFFAVSLWDISQEEAKSYIQVFKDDGFLPVSEQTAAPEGGSLVIADLWA